MEEFIRIRYNEDFAKSIDGDLLNKLVTFEGFIPDDINNVIRFNNSTYQTKRRDYVGDREYLLQLAYTVRAEEKRIKDYRDRRRHQDETVFKFVEDYPELKPLIDHVEFCVYDDEGVLKIIKEVPFDEYLDQYR